MIIFANAKINLGLLVHHKREDGYHEISTLMVPIPYSDVLEILPYSENTFQVLGQKVEGSPVNNLVLRAYHLFQKNFQGKTFRLVLQKNLPTGAGLGGGSADAAFTLKALNELNGNPFSHQQLEKMAGELGSDCPFFIRNTPQLCSGRGEIMKPFHLSALNDKFLVLVHPTIQVSTADAYSKVQLSTEDEFPMNLNDIPIHNWKEILRNDFEVSVFKSHPELKEIKQKLYLHGALYAAMSGSGSTLFGIFNQEPTIQFESCKIVIIKL